jgi:hypothetical protein
MNLAPMPARLPRPPDELPDSLAWSPQRQRACDATECTARSSAVGAGEVIVSRRPSPVARKEHDVAVVVWVMIGIALWHFAVLVPDRFWGGIIGAFLAALGGSLVTGFLLPSPGVPSENPPGIGEALWAMPGSVLGLAASYAYGAHRSRETTNDHER